MDSQRAAGRRARVAPVAMRRYFFDVCRAARESLDGFEVTTDVRTGDL